MEGKISRYFTWHEATYLPSWKREANESELTDTIKANLIKTFKVMDLIRELFGKAIIVHCAFRPTEYNTLVNGAKASRHLFGLAVDFHVQGIPCDVVRQRLLPLMKSYGFSMEWYPGSNWIHIDLSTPYRAFKV
jgi:uncharacterized protein YcbK (DUF882 family)